MEIDSSKNYRSQNPCTQRRKETGLLFLGKYRDWGVFAGRNLSCTDVLSLLSLYRDRVLLLCPPEPEDWATEGLLAVPWAERPTVTSAYTRAAETGEPCEDPNRETKPCGTWFWRTADRQLISIGCLCTRRREHLSLSQYWHSYCRRDSLPLV